MTTLVTAAPARVEQPSPIVVRADGTAQLLQRPWKDVGLAIVRFAPTG